MKKTILTIIRILISLGLLAYLFYLADVHLILETVSNIGFTDISLASLAFIISIFAFAWRWKIINKAFGIFSGYSSLLVFYSIGLFFNNFLPTSIGGDLSRAYYLARKSGNKSASVGTVFLERILGLLATMTLALVAFFWLFDELRSPLLILFSILFSAALFLFMVIILSRRLYKQINRLLGKLKLFDLGRRINDVLDTLHFFHNHKKVLLGAYFISLFSQFMVVLMNYVFAKALSLNTISFEYLVLVVPVTFVMSLLPSINGLGVRESGYVFFFGLKGVAAASAITVSLLVIVVPMLWSLIGGILIIFYKSPAISEENAS